jgi:crotonobetainyl-CoA:carnitine CoA-transferase CaiB-like acyl-CoA transferase
MLSRSKTRNGGDPQRGLVATGLIPEGGINFMVELPNRGKRSVGLDISTEAGQELLYRLVETADVFLTSHLPEVRQRLGIDLREKYRDSGALHACHYSLRHILY